MPKYCSTASDTDESQWYQVLPVKSDGFTLREVVEDNGLIYSRGLGFYQLGTKKENISKNKRLVVVPNDSWHAAVDEKQESRRLLGISLNSACSIRASDVSSDYLVFIQSTSANRALKKGSFALFHLEHPPSNAETDSSDCDNDQDSGNIDSGNIDEGISEENDCEFHSSSTNSRSRSSMHIGSKRRLSKREEKTVRVKRTRIDKVLDDVLSSTQAQPVACSETRFPYGLEWEEEKGGDMVYLSSACLSGSSKVACFDMDWTLIQPVSKLKFPRGRDDWKWWNDKVVSILTKYYKNGFKIVIFTNQGGISKGKQRQSDITGKILDLIEEIGFPIQAFVCTGTNYWRKPNTDMFDYFIRNCNQGVQVDLEQSLYVGDAAGRRAGWGGPKVKRDFSVSDRKFAANAGLQFFTPDEFFLNSAPVQFDWRGLDPARFLQTIENDRKGKKPFQGSCIVPDDKHQEMVIFVGPPASGKSTFAKTHFVPAGYEWINRDTLKTKAKCIKAAEAALAQGKSMVIDNTSPSWDARSPYVEAALDADVPVRCFVFDITRELSAHLNLYREKLTKGKVKRIPSVAFNVYYKKFEMPEVDSESLDEVCTVRFTPNFKNHKERTLFLQWT